MADEAEAMESEEQDTIAALKGPATPQGAKVGAFAGAPASKTPTSALRKHSMATPSGDAAPSSISKPIRVATPGRWTLVLVLIAMICRLPPCIN